MSLTKKKNNNWSETEVSRFKLEHLKTVILLPDRTLIITQLNQELIHATVKKLNVAETKELIKFLNIQYAEEIKNKILRG